MGSPQMCAWGNLTHTSQVCGIFILYLFLSNPNVRLEINNMDWV